MIVPKSTIITTAAVAMMVRNDRPSLRGIFIMSTGPGSVEGRSEARAQRHAIGTRFGEVRREDRIARRKVGRAEGGDLRRAARTLEGGGEGDLLVIGVEDVLSPEFQRPALVAAADADARVDQEEAVLALFQEQRLARIAADQIVAILRVRIGVAEVEGQILGRIGACLQFEALRDDARAHLARAGAGGRGIVTIGTVQAGAARPDILDDIVGAVEGVQLEVLERRTEAREVRGEFGRRIFDADFERLHRLGIEAQVRCGRRGERDDAADQWLERCGHRRTGEQGAERGLLRRADGVVVVEARIQALVLVGVAQAAGDAERVGDLEDVVREEGVVAARLVIQVAHAADVVDGAEAIDAADHRLADRGGQHGAAGSAQAAARRRIAQRGGRVHRRDGTACGEGAILRAEAQIIDDVEILVRVIAADQPVEPVVEQAAAEAGFLRERLELAIGVAVVGAVDDVDVAVVHVACAAGLVLAIGADRDELHVAQRPADARRHAAVGGDVRIGLALGLGDLAVVGIAHAGQHAAQALQYRDDAVLRGDREVARYARRRIELFARVDIDGAAALFVAMRVIADQADRKVGRRLPEQLTADEIAVAVVETPSMRKASLSAMIGPVSAPARRTAS
ncbi:hypothetical protein WR25_24878 [Diploscapter pachys]|uniref:Uncharacterized protein n=1 Tax=Diploscapter pachys TaxID=2018661 RepID=A0A2A2JX50_9BILA|nr:hypothetical protein WR25_24878 [Diploscapter pachys]